MGLIDDQSSAAPRCSHLMIACRALICTTGLLITVPALANADSTKFSIPAEPLPSALKEFAAQAHMQLLYQFSAVENVKANPVRGDLEKRDALAQLLRNTGLEAVYSSGSAATIRPMSASTPPDRQPTDRVTQGAAEEPKGGEDKLFRRISGGSGGSRIGSKHVYRSKHQSE